MVYFYLFYIIWIERPEMVHITADGIRFLLIKILFLFFQQIKPINPFSLFIVPSSIAIGGHCLVLF